MPFELHARTERGRRLVQLAQRLAAEVAPMAPGHDREGSFPFDSLAAVKASGYLTAPIPEQLGGLGVRSLHDILVASSRLARGDAGLALGVNMHLVLVSSLARRWQAAVAAGNDRRVKAFGATLEEIARDALVLGTAISETGQDLTRPATRARRTDDDWVISGKKVFCTMSPAADVLFTAVTYLDGEGQEIYGYAMVPAATPGVVVHDDWDALGMRSSGSNSVSFDNVRLPASALRGGFPAGSATGYVERNVDGGLFHAAVALGVAEGADAEATAAVARRRGTPDGRTRTLAAESAIELAACRAILARAGTLLDEGLALEPANPTALFAEAQAAKTFVGEAAVRVVDRALALSGGAGYLNGSPIARAYRDVRATAFMHPLGANHAYDYLGAHALDLEPAIV
ncbi:MAG TPA: acyl-CoA dehydrogenase family protein [Gaiellales bacterium]|jgi:alkylation response protein AidB-like acyl-CoA dehydrogenase|nr:acyl-CoA dehydrogenase family protein [Gaiellales bacterium]